MILAYALEKGWDDAQFDVSSAFLNTPMPDSETVYVEPLEKYGLAKKWVFKLQRMLYGLVQASRGWQQHITSKFKGFGFKASSADQCIFIRRDNNGEVDCITGIHTDDGLVAGEKSAIKATLDMLKTHYTIRELDGQINKYVGMKIEYSKDRRTVTLSQEAFIDNILETHGMANCNSSKVPAAEKPVQPPDEPMTEEEAEFMKNKTVAYLSIIGALMYLLRATRPDIAFSVGYLSRFVNNPRKVHWTALMKILRYLKGTKSWGLRYTKSSKLDNGRVPQSTCYVDADHAGTSARSISGFAILFANAALDWGSWIQTVVARSTTESEIVALDTGDKRQLWLRKHEKELDIGHGKPSKIFEDNNGAIAWAKDRRRTKHTKHIAVRFAAVSDDVEQDRVSIEGVNTDENVADIFTKGLAFFKFSKFRAMLGMVDTNV
jgi:hypothetical protein